MSGEEFTLTPDEVQDQVDEYLKSLMSLMRTAARRSRLDKELQSELGGVGYRSLERYRAQLTGGISHNFFRFAGIYGLLPSQYAYPRQALEELRDHPARVRRTARLLGTNHKASRLLAEAAVARSTQISRALAAYADTFGLSAEDLASRSGLDVQTVSRMLVRADGGGLLGTQLRLGVAMGFTPDQVFSLPEWLQGRAPEPRKFAPFNWEGGASGVRSAKYVDVPAFEVTRERRSIDAVRRSKERRSAVLQRSRLPDATTDLTAREIEREVSAYLKSLMKLAVKVRIDSQLSKQLRMQLFGSSYNNVLKYEGKTLGGTASMFYRYIGMLGVRPSQFGSIGEGLAKLEDDPVKVREWGNLLGSVPGISEQLKAAGIVRANEVCTALVTYADIHSVSDIQLAERIGVSQQTVWRYLARGSDYGGGSLYLQMCIGRAMGLTPDEVFSLPETLQEMAPAVVKRAWQIQQTSSDVPKRDDVEKKVSAYVSDLTGIIDAIDIPSRTPKRLQKHIFGVERSLENHGYRTRHNTSTILCYAALAGVLPSRYPVLKDTLLYLKGDTARANRTLQLLAAMPDAHAYLEESASLRSAQINGALAMYAKWLGVSQPQLEERSGVGQQTISTVFGRPDRGGTFLTTQLKVGVALGLEPDQVLRLPELMQVPERQVRVRTSWREPAPQTQKSPKSVRRSVQRGSRRPSRSSRCLDGSSRIESEYKTRPRDAVDTHLDEFVTNVRVASDFTRLPRSRVTALFGSSYEFSESVGDPSNRWAVTLLRLASAVGVSPHQYRNAPAMLRRLAENPDEVDRCTARLMYLPGDPSSIMRSSATSWSQDMSRSLATVAREAGFTIAHIDRLTQMGARTIWDVLNKNADGTRTMSSILRIGSALGVDPDHVFGLPDLVQEPLRVPYIPRGGNFDSPLEVTASRITHLARLSAASEPFRHQVESAVCLGPGPGIVQLSLAKDDVFPVGHEELQRLCAGALLALPENGFSLQTDLRDVAIDLWGGSPRRLGPTLDSNEYSLVS